MIHPGLVSITFRQLSPQEIVGLVAQAELDGIEWGGDVHVGHGDVPQARAVRKMTEQAGLAVAAYGSYYKVGHQETGPFAAVLETALALGAPVIRIWAGERGSDVADDAYRQMVIQESRRIGDAAAAAGLSLAYEYHQGTLTDTPESAERLLEAVAHDAVGSYWQPFFEVDRARNLAGLRAMLPWLSNIHVQSRDSANESCPLVETEQDWQCYLEVIPAGDDRFAMIEFVVDQTPEHFLQDARTLKRWLGRWGK